MNKKFIMIGLMAIGGIMMFASSKKSNSTSNTHKYEGKLVYSVLNEWESIYVINGVGYKITTSAGWAGLNQKLSEKQNIGLLSITLYIPDAEYKAIKVVGYVSDTGDLIDATSKMTKQ